MLQAPDRASFRWLATSITISTMFMSLLFVVPAVQAAARPPVSPPPETSPTPAPTYPLTPNSLQIPVLYVAVIFFVLDFALWALPGARLVIAPFKLLTIGWHELCHMLVALLTGGEIISVSIDPNNGGCTRVEGGTPAAILSAGYIGSTLFGAGLILGGFDILAAKICSFVIAAGLAIPLILVRDKLTIILTVFYEGLLVGFWFIDHGSALRWYCLFVGIMNVFFALWDYLDDAYFKKANDSDCTQYSLLYPKTKPNHWALVWVTFEIIIFIGFILLGIAELKRTEDQMYSEAASFLPTR
ncbi:hypothetical protein DL93DRAFT_2164971 [Clavulina sp. PMI_390]|nr:hypothetical protein DL93DRAFT_2164971 [Clavulina sp. PMI_390]